MSHKHIGQNHGFTLIELLVVTTITMITLGGGLAAYTTFNDKQTVISAGQELMTLVLTAQTKMRAGERPPGCVELKSYTITGSTGSSQITISATCINPSATVLVRTYTLPNAVTLSSDLSYQFVGLRGEVQGAGTVTVGKAGWSYTFEVRNGGEISQGQVSSQ